MKYTICLCLLVLCVSRTSYGGSDNVIERLEMLERRQRESDDKIQRLQKLTVAQSTTINELRADNLEQKQVIAELTERVQRTEDKLSRDSPKQDVTGVKRQEPAEKLAFTAYTTTAMTPAATEIIKFDHVLTNVGGGYSTATGMFTANQDGLYLFSVTISEVQENHFIWADLVVNGNKQVEAAAETFHHEQDVQGSNLAVVSLQANDMVWVTVRTATQLPGGTPYRLTTFTGVFLY